MVIFVKILGFSKIVKNGGGSVGAEISARWQKFTKKNFLWTHTFMYPKLRFDVTFTFGAMFCQL